MFFFVSSQFVSRVRIFYLILIFVNVFIKMNSGISKKGGMQTIDYIMQVKKKSTNITEKI